MDMLDGHISKWRIFLLLTVIGVPVDRVEGNVSMDDVDRLIKEKRENYNVFIRPKFNQSEPLHIGMAFDLIAIRDFDEVTEKFSVVGTVYMIWKDDRMVWDPANYSDLFSLVIEHRDFWTPPFIIVNAFEQFHKVGGESFWPIRFYHNGDVLYQPGQVFTTTCSVNVELYPWDIQSCYILFNVWGHAEHEVTLFPYDNSTKVSTSYFSGNGEWDLIDTRAWNYGNSLFAFEFIMRRKPLFIVVNTVVPIIFMSILNIMGFLIPIQSGERVSYCITVLLAVAVFLTLISDTMPRSATHVAFLCYYLVCVLALSVLIIFASIVSMRFYFKPDTGKVPWYWSLFVRCARCRVCRDKKQTRHKKKAYGYPSSESRQDFDDPVYNGKNHIGPIRVMHPNRINIISKSDHLPWMETMSNYSAASHKLRNRSSGRPINDDNAGLDEANEEKNGNVTWKDVSGAFDLVFGVFSLICLIVFTVAFLVYTGTSAEYVED